MERMFVSFVLGNQEFAAPIETISEVINLSELYPVPKAPDYLLGVMSLRGDVLSVIDLAKKLGVKREDNNEAEKGNSNLTEEDNVEFEDEIEEETTKKMLVVNVNGTKVGFVVDNIKGILKIKEENIAPAENVVDVKEEFLQGIAHLDDGRVIFIIDVKKVLSHKEVAKMQEEIHQIKQ